MFYVPAMYNLKIQTMETPFSLEPKMIKFLEINLIEIQDIYRKF